MRETPPEAAFLFATCNPGREKSLKAEVKSRWGEALAPAFLRPGLVTWKVKDPTAPITEGPPPVFSHVFGESLGLAREDHEIPGLAAPLGNGPFRLHVFPRVLPGNGWTEGEWAEIDARRGGILLRLREAGLAPETDETPRPGDPVLDLVLGDAGEAVFAGWHHHAPDRRPFPGGMPRAVLPGDAPSRAWLKMEQGLAGLGLGGPGSLRGWKVLELGCAPGGGSLSLLSHGAEVWGVDPAEMDPRVLDFAGPDGARFTHLARPAGEVDLRELPRRIDLLASDMNLAPPVALRYIERLQRRVRARALLLTLKINDARMEAAIPGFIEQVRRFAPGSPIATQLPANRSEITVLAREFR